ncbi:MAG: Arc family DNA binding domain-containing protein [Chloroflexi bacterium]|nr:Arc family DNA binding domain-containing protein [Chloroflexota bacterium]
MADKKAFLVRLDEALLEALQRWAADELRSANGQFEWIVRHALQEAGRLPSASERAARDRR